MDSMEIIKAQMVDINQSFGRAVTTMEGWLGTLSVMYFSPGTIGATILGLCLVDLFTGTILALKVRRWVNEGLENKNFPELTEAILAGKKEPFNWKKWGTWTEKVFIVFGLTFGGEWFKLYLAHNPYSAEIGNYGVNAVYFVLMFTNFRSSVRNTALVTENQLLLSMWKLLGRDGGLPTNMDFLRGLSQQPDVNVKTEVVVVQTTETEKETNGTA